MKRRERILRNVLHYNQMYFLEHARMPINTRNERRLSRLKRTIVALGRRIGKRPLFTGQMMMDFSTPKRSWIGKLKQLWK